MKKTNIYLLAGACCSLLVLGPRAMCADGVQAGEAKPVSMALSAKVGDTVRYKTTLKVGDDIVVEQSRKYTIKELKDNGDAVVLVADEGGKAVAGGNEIDLPG